MFKRRFAEWDLYKVVREQDVSQLENEIAAYRILHNRTPAVLKVNGRFVEAEKVIRSLKRHRTRPRKASDESDPPDLTTSDYSPTVLGDDVPETPVFDITLGASDCTIQLSPASEAPLKHTDDPLDTKSYSIVDLKRHQTGLLLNFTPQEMNALSLAILQTDYHWGELHVERSFNGTVRAFTSSPHGLIPSALISSHATMLHQSRELLDLESILYQSSMYYDNLALKRRSLISSHQCSTHEATQARDFYARYWLGLILGAGASHRDLRLAWSLYDSVFAQTGPVLKEDHPHFLPWICFIICYPPRWAHNAHEAQILQEKTLSFAQWMTESVGGRTDPRFIIQQKLSRSSHRRDIALVLLRYIVETFHRTTQGHYVQDLQLLAQLFDHINQEDELDEVEVEKTLRKWAKASLSIAEVIERDELQMVCNTTVSCAA
jgi:hypothetical protein